LGQFSEIHGEPGKFSIPFKHVFMSEIFTFHCVEVSVEVRTDVGVGEQDLLRAHEIDNTCE